MSHWSFSASVPMTLLGLAVWLGGGWLCWQNWSRRGATRGVGFLEALRFLIMTLIGFTLLRPEWVKQIVHTESPEIVVLTDASASMGTRDVPLSATNVIKRAEWLAQQQATKYWAPWEKQARVTFEEFSAPPVADTNANAAPIVAPGREEGSDLNEALDNVLLRHNHLKAVLLFTDGDWNLGSSPVSAATRYRALGVPVYTVSVGSETPLPDLVLQHVAAPAYGLLGEQISIPFKIQSHLPREVRTTVTLHAGESVEARKEIVIPAFAQFQDTLVWLPRTMGEKTLSLRLPVQPDESLNDNNEQEFRIAIRAEKLRVLVVESLPRWEYRFLRNALERDPGVELSCLLFHPGMPVGDGRNYIQTFPPTKEAIAKYDVVFLGDVGVGEGELRAADLELLRGLVEQQGSGLIFLPGARGRQLSLTPTPVGELLPIVFDDAKPAGTGLPNESGLVLTTTGKAHFLTMLANDEAANEVVWRNLPGFYWSAPVLKSRAGSEVLAVHTALRNASGRVPLLVTRPFGNGEVLFMGTDSAWRWRRGVEDKYHYRFWGQVVRWMSHKRHLSEGKGVRLSYSPENPQVGESIFLNAAVFDAAGLPLEKGPVTATIVAPGGRTERMELVSVPGGWGLFKGSFPATTGGKYKVTVTGDKAARGLDTEIMVTQIRREKLGQPVNGAILREIAELTRGQSGTFLDLARLTQQIAVLPEVQPEERRFQIWASPWWGALLLGLLAVYWIGRKIVGLV